MKREIIALRGGGNCGKSTSIKRVFEILSRECSIALLGPNDGVADIHVVFTLNGKRIGLESQGDPSSRLQESLAKFEALGCDVIVCAARTRGMTNDWIRALEPKYKISWIAKERAANASAQSTENEVCARKIVDMVKGLVGL